MNFLTVIFFRFTVRNNLIIIILIIFIVAVVFINTGQRAR